MLRVLGQLFSGFTAAHLFSVRTPLLPSFGSCKTFPERPSFHVFLFLFVFHGCDVLALILAGGD